jgi:hypothetical protein
MRKPAALVAALYPKHGLNSTIHPCTTYTPQSDGTLSKYSITWLEFRFPLNNLLSLLRRGAVSGQAARCRDAEESYCSHGWRHVAIV